MRLTRIYCVFYIFASEIEKKKIFEHTHSVRSNWNGGLSHRLIIFTFTNLFIIKEISNELHPNFLSKHQAICTAKINIKLNRMQNLFIVMVSQITWGVDKKEHQILNESIKMSEYTKTWE